MGASQGSSSLTHYMRAVTRSSPTLLDSSHGRRHHSPLPATADAAHVLSLLLLLMLLLLLLLLLCAAAAAAAAAVCALMFFRRCRLPTSPRWRTTTRSARWAWTRRSSRGSNSCCCSQRPRLHPHRVLALVLLPTPLLRPLLVCRSTPPATRFSRPRRHHHLSGGTDLPSSRHVHAQSVACMLGRNEIRSLSPPSR